MEDAEDAAGEVVWVVVGCDSDVVVVSCGEGVFGFVYASFCFWCGCVVAEGLGEGGCDFSLGFDWDLLVECVCVWLFVGGLDFLEECFESFLEVGEDGCDLGCGHVWFVVVEECVVGCFGLFDFLEDVCFLFGEVEEFGEVGFEEVVVVGFFGFFPCVDGYGLLFCDV